MGVGMPSGEEEGAASGRGGPGKRNRWRRVARAASGAARGSSLRGAASGLLRARWAGVGVPSYEEGGVGGGREGEIGGGVARARRWGRPGAPW